MNQCSMICYSMLPLKLWYSPSNYSPFLTGMAKEARIVQILNLNPPIPTGPSSCHQFETRVQWSGLRCRWIELWSVACGILAYHTFAQPLQWDDQDDLVPVHVLEKMVVQCSPGLMWTFLSLLPCPHLLPQHCPLGFEKYQHWCCDHLVTLSFCTLVLWPFSDNKHCTYFSFIYMMMLLSFHLSFHVLFLFSLYMHVSLLYAILYFCFTLRCLNEFCLKCFRKTSC